MASKMEKHRSYMAFLNQIESKMKGADPAILRRLRSVGVDMGILLDGDNSNSDIIVRYLDIAVKHIYNNYKAKGINVAMSEALDKLNTGLETVDMSSY